MRSVFSACAIVAALLLPQRGEAYVCKTTESHVSLRWETRNITYGIESGAGLPLSHVAAAFGAWAEQACTDLDFEYVGEVAPGDDSANVVRVVREGWPAEQESLAVTTTTYNVKSGEIVRATIDINAENFIFMDVTEGPCGPGTDTHDLIAVLTHEVGHFIGLDHSDDVMATMYESSPHCSASLRTLQPDDHEGVCFIYPAGEDSGRCDRLPEGVQVYVSSEPFGCSAHTVGEPNRQYLGWLFLCFVGYWRRAPMRRIVRRNARRSRRAFLSCARREFRRTARRAASKADAE